MTMTVYLIAIGYYAAARLGLLLSLGQTNASPVWPAAGLALACTRLYGRRVWPGIWAGAFLANLVTFHSYGRGVAAAIGLSAMIASGNTAEALAGAAWIRRFCGRSLYPETANALVLFFYSAGAAALISCTNGVAALHLFRQLSASGTLPAWFTWWLGDTAGIFLFALPILAWRDSHVYERESWRALLALAAGLIATCVFAYTPVFWTAVAHYPLRFLPFPILVWAAFRFQPRYTTLSVIYVALFALWATLHRAGPFYEALVDLGAQGSYMAALWFLQIYLCILGATTLAVGAVVQDRKRNEHAARQLAAIIETSDDAVLSKSLDGTLLTWNRGAERLYGFTAAQAIGRPVSFLVPLDRRDEADELVRRVAAGESISNVETVRLRKDGVPIHVAQTISPVKDSSGRVIAISAIARDIGERKRADAALRRAKIDLEDRVKRRTAELERSNQELDRFASIVSHDLQEPLRKIIAFSELLKSRGAGQLTPTLLDYLERMQGSALRMTKFVEGLLAASRATVQKDFTQTIDLNLLLKGVLIDLSDQLERTLGRVHVDALPAVTGNELQMRQLFQNLVSNALKFHRPGHPPRVRVRYLGSSAGFYRFAVEDHGTGFDPGSEKKLFHPFTRFHDRTYPGSGMGLSICKMIVERHGGTIEAASWPGKGSVFTIKLPVADRAKQGGKDDQTLRAENRAGG